MDDSIQTERPSSNLEAFGYWKVSSFIITSTLYQFLKPVDGQMGIKLIFVDDEKSHIRVEIGGEALLIGNYFPFNTGIVKKASKCAGPFLSILLAIQKKEHFLQMTDKHGETLNNLSFNEIRSLFEEDWPLCEMIGKKLEVLMDDKFMQKHQRWLGFAF